MSIKPYIQYGIGIQKVIKDNFMAFGLAMIQNGGRSGFGLNFELRWEVYGDKHMDTVNGVENPATIVLVPYLPDKTTVEEKEETPKVKKPEDVVIELSAAKRPLNNLNVSYSQRDVVDLDVPESVTQPIVLKQNSNTLWLFLNSLYFCFQKTHTLLECH